MRLAAMALLAGLFAALSGFAEAQDKRIALVIANAKYAHAPALGNPGNDGRGMAAALKRLGFAVTESYDESKAGMERALRAFRQTARGSDMALVFYAGHAIQVTGQNHLLPVDAKLAEVDDLRYETIPLDNVLSAVEGASKVRVVILDSCRDNPFGAKLTAVLGPGRSAAIGRGLAVTAIGGGNTLIAYATKEGLIAEDGRGARNSPYTTALLRHIEEPGLDLNQFFGKVRDSVVAATAGQQQPFVYGSLGGERFFLKTPDGMVATPVPAPVPLDSAAVELAYWNSVKDSQSSAEYEAYLKEYPKGRFAQLAQTRIAALRPKPEAAPRPAQPAVGNFSLQPGQVFRDCPDCPEMVAIPKGNFTMGVLPGEEEREGIPDQFKRRSVPQHDVSIRSFMLGKYEVTVGEFAIFASETKLETDGCWVWSGKGWAPSPWRNNLLAEHNKKIERILSSKPRGILDDGEPFWISNKMAFKDGIDEWSLDDTKDFSLAKYWRNPGFGQGDRHPVTCVRWDDAQAYATWLSQKTGRKYRLPSEAEWEYAARAGTATSRFWGDDRNRGCDYANIADQTIKTEVSGAAGLSAASCKDGYVYASPVGSFRANAFGLHDMIGNVWEWTADCWNENYNGAPSDGTAWEYGDCFQRVRRGGAWASSPGFARAGVRFRSSRIGFASHNVGFRVARNLD